MAYYILSAHYRDRRDAIISPADGAPDGREFRLQITDALNVLSIVTTPTPAYLPLSYNSTELIPLRIWNRFGERGWGCVGQWDVERSWWWGRRC
jgi:hypothetical protein